MLSTRNNPVAKYFWIYLGVTLFSAFFTLMYYIFDHGLRDVNMTLLFLPGLIATLLFLLLALFHKDVSRLAIYTFNTGFPALWCYMALAGIYNMAKTESEWLFVFLILGAVLLTISLVSETIYLVKDKKQTEAVKNG